jgi:hypothetical protein
MEDKVDKRRWRAIAVRFRSRPVPTYSLTIDGELWAAVEWSTTRRTWCIEDAAGHCLAHCEHIHGGDIDRPTAIALAKEMIVDGRIPTPEEANRQLAAEQAARDGPVKRAPSKRRKRSSRSAITAAELKRLEAVAADGMRQLDAMRREEVQRVASVAPQLPRRRHKP